MSRCLQIIQHVLRLYCVRARELLRTSRNLKEELEAPITLYIDFLEFFEEDWSPLPTLIRHSLVYTALQGKFVTTLTGMEKGNAW